MGEDVHRRPARGPTKKPQAWGARPTPLGAPPELVGPLAGLWPLLLLYEAICPRKKIRRRLLGRSAAVSRRNLGRSYFALWQSDSTGDTSLREGEIEAIDITNDPLIVGGPIFINIFTSTISSQTLVHLLYSIFVSKPQIGTCGLLVVLITSCS